MEDKKSIRFIINPISGTNNKEAIVSLIPEYLDSEKFTWEICYTTHAGHAEELAKNAIEEHFDVAVAVGGDGTVNEVARALTHSNTALGIIPCGSGNGLARHLYIPMNPSGALQILSQCDIETLDYGKINDQPFFCTCGVGFDAFVSLKFAESGKRGLLSYIENTLREGLKYKPETYKIRFDDEEQEYNAFLIACANASQYGNNAYIAPAASMSDGLMDVTIMEPFNVIEAPQIAIQLFNKTIERNSHIKTFKCKYLHISREHEGAIHFDGDPMNCGKELDIRLIRAGIRIVVNSQEQLIQPPLFRAFSNVYDDMQNEVLHLRDEFHRTDIRIKALNRNLLRRLRK